MSDRVLMVITGTWAIAMVVWGIYERVVVQPCKRARDRAEITAFWQRALEDHKRAEAARVASPQAEQGPKN